MKIFILLQHLFYFIADETRPAIKYMLYLFHFYFILLQDGFMKPDLQ